MIYILLPAYNEEVSIDPLFDKFSKYFNSISHFDYKIIICNDGSKDNTLNKIKNWQDKLAIEVINHKINRGLGETARDLFERAAELAKDDDIIIRLDCDDTHEPEFIEGMINKLNEGYDVVIASRFVKGGGQEGLDWYRRTISKAANIFMRIVFPIKGLKEYSSGYRAYRAKIIKDAIELYGNQFIQLKGLGFTGTLEKVVKLKMLGAKFGEAPMILRYDQKMSSSKMIGSITTFGYFSLALLYHWPFGGWKSQYKRKLKNKKP